VGEERQTLAVVRQAGYKIVMNRSFIWLTGVLLAALLIETIFRMMNRFSKEQRNLFRWIYVGGSGLIGVCLTIGAWKDITSLDSYQNDVLLAGLVIVIMAIVFTVLINFKKDK
jgi:hypothetical protein